jgi:hypothetical protein
MELKDVLAQRDCALPPDMVLKVAEHVVEYIRKNKPNTEDIYYMYSEVLVQTIAITTIAISADTSLEKQSVNDALLGLLDSRQLFMIDNLLDDMEKKHAK